MVYSLVCTVMRSNLKISTKTLLNANFILQKRLPSVFDSYIPYRCASDEKKEEKKTPIKPSFSNGKSLVYHIINQAKKGKINMDDISTLAQRVIAEGQYQNYTQAPQTVQYVGFAGLAPMLGIPVLSLLSGNPMAFAHLAYGATVLSFLGGSNWHEAINNKDMSMEKLIWCVTPQLMGWTSLLLPIPLGMLLTTFGFCLSIVHDVLLSTYPPWMKSLRLVLTAGTVVSFPLMLLFYIML